MKNAGLKCTTSVKVAFVSMAGLGALTTVMAGDREPRVAAPRHFSGLLNDYTPSAALVTGGPYEMRGKWSLDVDEARGTARFSAAMNMETSDYGITQLTAAGAPTVDKDDPTTRGAHTHHISMTDGVVTYDWNTACPVFKPAVTGGFVITGSAFVTGNGGPAPFGNPSPLTICVLGGANVEFSNITLTFGKPAQTHFGTHAIHGVVLRCSGPREREARDCVVEE